MSSALQFHERPRVLLPPLIGASPAIELARARIQRFARSGIAVLLLGATGTGKEVVARHLHALSGRRGDLIDVNCGALPRDMIESLLFGHRKGAFTGAMESTTGFIARAHGGTLFLDELTALSTEGQAKLLRVLETGEVTPLGAVVKECVDVRLVAAVQEDIGVLLDRQQFRHDLFHRINGVTIELPPLAERTEDIEPLASHFAAVRGCRLGLGVATRLERQAWHGNVRELRAVIERACVLADGATIDGAIIQEALDAGYQGMYPRGWTSRSELLAVAASEAGDPLRIARVLGISRATLYRRLRELGLTMRQLSGAGSPGPAFPVSTDRETR